MKIKELITFHDNLFFDGAVQLNWILKDKELADEAARAFVFHGPQYHGASGAASDGFDGAYQLKDTASFVNDLVDSCLLGKSGEDANPYWLAVAGYGSGKSHLALTCASLLSGPSSDIAENILEKVNLADDGLAKNIRDNLLELSRPFLTLPLDGMGNFHLGNALSQVVFQQLKSYGVDATPIHNLSPRFQTAAQFVERNFEMRNELFTEQFPNMTCDDICSRLYENDDFIYSKVDAIYLEANGRPIPVEGQESAQELIQTLCDEYCDENGPFSGIVILFDEFGRYLEYAAEKPHLAGDSALQQIFQGVQDNSENVRFVGFVQYELKTYLKRFAGAGLRQLQRYVTRFDTAEKWYLSSNMETIFAHLIGKEVDLLSDAFDNVSFDSKSELCWDRMRECLPGYDRFPVWEDLNKFTYIIARGCWPLHPLTIWFLSRQNDIVQSRSALTFVRNSIARIGEKIAFVDGGLYQISVAELILHNNMLPELIAAERDTGGTTAETLQVLLGKFDGHLSKEAQLALVGVAAVDKMRIGGVGSQNVMNSLLSEATSLASASLSDAIEDLLELGALEWNRDLGKYELLSDGASRGQYRQWLRGQLSTLEASSIQELFLRKANPEFSLDHIKPDFPHSNQISTQDWIFESQLAHAGNVENWIETCFKHWKTAISPDDAKGKVIYLYLGEDQDYEKVEEVILSKFKSELGKCHQQAAPILVAILHDHDGTIAEHLSLLHILEDTLSQNDEERYKRFIYDELQASKLGLKVALESRLKERNYLAAGIPDVPSARLKVVADFIFTKIYPSVIPFNFDGFSSQAAGRGGMDVGTLIRGLVLQQVNGVWAQAQLKRLQNRIDVLFVKTWLTLSSRGKLGVPQHPDVQRVFLQAEEAHKTNPALTLFDTYKLLIAPPYGLNAASAGLIIGLLIGLDTPPRRISHDGAIVSSQSWASLACPGKPGKHYFVESVLSKSTLHFLAADSETRWKTLLNAWEGETQYVKIVEYGREAASLSDLDPIPEAQEGTLKFLNKKTETALEEIASVEKRLVKIDSYLKLAEQKLSVDSYLLSGSKLLKLKNELENDVWDDVIRSECDDLLSIVVQLVAHSVASWIPEQICSKHSKLDEWRKQGESNVKTLERLGFRAEARQLEKQLISATTRIAELKKHEKIFSRVDKYIRDIDPTPSTPVRELRDNINEGDELITAIQKIASLSDLEKKTRIASIEARQQKVKTVVNERRNELASIYDMPESLQDLKEAISRSNNIRNIFLNTADESEITELIHQLTFILSDVSSWATEDLSPERIVALLDSQIFNHIAAFGEMLEEKGYEAFWDASDVYNAIKQEHIDAAQKRSANWIQPYSLLNGEINNYDKETCSTLRSELISAPQFLADQDIRIVKGLLTKVDMQLLNIESQRRREAISEWMNDVMKPIDLDTIDKFEIENMLAKIKSPPYTLTRDEKNSISPQIDLLTSHLDRLSLDELLARIKQLPMNLQNELYHNLYTMIGGELLEKLEN